MNSLYKPADSIYKQYEEPPSAVLTPPISLTMGFFNKASNFTINGTTMNDVGGDYTTNNNTTNDNRSNCNNMKKSTVQGSYNNHSQRVVAAGACVE